MEKLIVELQSSLDEEEELKRALLLLKRGESESKMTKFASTTVQAGNVKLNERLISIDAFALQKFIMCLVSDCSTYEALPMKIIAFQLGMSYKNVRNIVAATKRNYIWPSNFVSCYLQILNLVEQFSYQSFKSPDLQYQYRQKIQLQRFEISIVQNSSRVSVAQFILACIARFVEENAIPLMLEGHQQQYCNYKSNTATATAALNTRIFFMPLYLSSIDSNFVTRKKKRCYRDESSLLTHRKNFNSSHVHGYINNSANSRCKNNTAASLLLLDNDETTGALSSSSLSYERNVVILLAPLKLQQRSPKHFIIPLLEPDVYGNCSTTTKLAKSSCCLSSSSSSTTSFVHFANISTSIDSSSCLLPNIQFMRMLLTYSDNNTSSNSNNNDNKRDTKTKTSNDEILKQIPVIQQ